MTSASRRVVTLSLTALVALLAAGQQRTAKAGLRLADICRVMGQEAYTLTGMGLVTGLKGTGDPDLKNQLLAKLMENLGNPLPTDPKTRRAFEDLKKVNGVALVLVSVKVPGNGTLRGDVLDCTVTALQAKSLEGGVLAPTVLRLGPHDLTAYGLATGQLVLDDTTVPTTARVHRGCQMYASLKNDFVHDGKVSLILNEYHTSFRMAQDIEDEINKQLDFGDGTSRAGVAKALDAQTIEVRIPPHYVETPVLFVSALLDLQVVGSRDGGRVVVNERTGTIVIDEEVEIRPSVITHKNMVIETSGQRIGQFVDFEPTSQPNTTKLKALVDALNSVRVPNRDVIDIIKRIDAAGNLQGRLIVQ